MMINKALEICYEAHKNQVDKGNKPYFLHPITVALNCQTEEEKVVALLHDVVEDTDITLNDLGKYFDDDIIKAIDLLTHKKDEDYMTYLSKIKENDVARNVKLCDLKNNMDLSRIPNPRKKDYDRLNNKYIPAYEFLKRE